MSQPSFIWLPSLFYQRIKKLFIVTSFTTSQSFVSIPFIVCSHVHFNVCNKKVKELEPITLHGASILGCEPIDGVLGVLSSNQNNIATFVFFPSGGKK